MYHCPADPISMGYDELLAASRSVQTPCRAGYLEEVHDYSLQYLLRIRDTRIVA